MDYYKRRDAQRAHHMLTHLRQFHHTSGSVTSLVRASITLNTSIEKVMF